MDLTCRWVDKKCDRHTHRQTHKHTHTQTNLYSVYTYHWTDNNMVTVLQLICYYCTIGKIKRF